MTTLDHLRNRDAVLRMSESEAEERASVVDPDDERMIINMGPQHPSTHGVLRVTMELQGETVLRSKPVIGYLHTGMEKTGEENGLRSAVVHRVDIFARSRSVARSRNP